MVNDGQERLRQEVTVALTSPLSNSAETALGGYSLVIETSLLM